ncbi:MAG: MBL fold metallo-hydrolase [Proteobacteria bacterium]|nr:MBL fold metallo-hydrolase [Pseudomonadota bacterium]
MKPKNSWIQGRLSKLMRQSGSSHSTPSQHQGAARNLIKQYRLFINTNNPVMQIHLIKTPFVNSYLIEEAGHILVIDVAIYGEKYIMGYLEEKLNRSVDEIDLVICTHDDKDHFGGVVALAREANAKFAKPYAAHSHRKKVIRDPAGILYRPVTILKEAMRPRMWKMYLNPRRRRRVKQIPLRHPKVGSTLGDKKVDPHFLLKKNYTIPGFPNWQIIHTPGHSWDSCCFYHQQSGSLITGDTLLASQKKGISLLPSIYSSRKKMKQSVAVLKTLNPRIIHPGHGSVLKGENLLDHL